MEHKKILIIGGGVAGLSAALALEQLGIKASIVEKTGFLGGHAIQYACKATDQCVKCGACVVEEKLKAVAENPDIRIFLNSQIKNKAQNNGRSVITLHCQPPYIDPHKCTDCGQCYAQCPGKGAIEQGFSPNNHPLYALNADKCLRFTGQDCHICEDVCPEKAIDLNQQPYKHICEINAVIVASGFKAFEPVDKPYGWQVFDNVVTNLELERMLRRQSIAVRPSDGQIARCIAFIQCVGSRDATLNHLWCSKVCCGSALRMARVIKTRHPESEITFFYMDVQNSGKDFEKFYAAVQNDIHEIRCLPGDVYQTSDGSLQVSHFDRHDRQSVEHIFDLVVLSVGITPGSDTGELADCLQLKPEPTGFFSASPTQLGIFTAGAAAGPMTIEDAIASAGQAVWQTVQYLKTC
ncbi:FAD-dependent oxidoreductase [Desulfococcaceae bacterium HSG7]|nr:FAD-dependent oxidoreductase [Desulfococcaceae bacterium HSG7]